MSAVFVGNDPEKCDHIYPRTRDGRCHGCGTVPETTTFPTTPFPDDSEKKEFPVESTMRAMRDTFSYAKQRVKGWAYVREDVLTTSAAEFFKRPDNAPVRSKGGVIAVWCGDGEPTVEPEF